MAKSLLSLRSKKVKRSTKSESYLINLKYLGEEPILKGDVDDSALGKALTWYNYMCEDNDAREYIIEYLKATKQDALLKKFRRVPMSRVPKTYAWVYRIKTRGGAIHPDTLMRADRAIQACLEYMEAESIDEPKQVVERPTIQDRVKERVNDIIGDVECILDSGELINMYEWLQKNSIPPAHARKIAEYYKPLCDEYAYALTVDNEGYENYTKSQLKTKLGYVLKLVEDCERFAGNVKKARAPRKKKAPTVDKLLKHFQYQKDSNEYKLQSVAPESIIGAQELWTFNTKYKTISVFRARGPSGLSVRRTSIDSYDSESSLTKRVGRKPEEYIKKVLSGGKIILRKLMDEIKAEPSTFSDRINNNTILLKVVR